MVVKVEACPHATNMHTALMKMRCTCMSNGELVCKTLFHNEPPEGGTSVMLA